MCGLAGIISSSSDIEIKNITDLMSDELIRRGPDSNGKYFNSTNFNNNLVSIAHRRLSIIDLSEKGHQPMISKSKRYIIAFNGEIYNFKSIKRKIDNVKNVGWNGNSDTEVLIESIDIFGLKKTLNLLVGMFAFSLIDKQENKLYLVRDRFGEKPLYYGFIGDSNEKSLVFASEIHAIRKIPFFQENIDELSLDYFLRLSYIPSPLSIYKNIFKVKSGNMVSFNLNKSLFNEKPSINQWFSYEELFSKNINSKFSNEKDAIEALENSIKKATLEQSISDVPLGCFLSGGIDSSLIAATLQGQSSGKINTFTIGFDNNEFDESKHAKKVADYLGTNHNEFILEPDDALKIIEDLPHIYSEPFADSSQIPTALICQKIKSSGITVALSGDGGDEVFGGYVRHFMVPNLWSKMRIIPFEIRKLLGELFLKKQFSVLNNLHFFNSYNFENKFIKLASRLRFVRSEEELFKSLIIDNFNEKMYTNSCLDSILNSFNNKVNLFPNLNSEKHIDFFEKMLIWDSLAYLTDDILVKVDRASMFYSLETRAPFLDHRLIEVASRIPSNLKVKNNYGKHILKKLLYKYVPKKLVDRPKSGFAVPINDWLRGPLKMWAYDLIHSKDHYINESFVKKIWEKHLEGDNSNSIILWRILMWKYWLFSNSSNAL